MSLGRPGRAAAALALTAALLSPALAAGAPLDVAEQETSAVESRLGAVSRSYGDPDESPPARARRQFSEGETQFLLGDWLHAAVLLYGALDEPGFRASADGPRALLYLGDALREQGACGAALTPYEELLRLPAGPTLAPALTGALDCRIKLKRLGGVQPLLDTAAGVLRGGQPAELAYLAGKARYFRTDLRPADRVEQAMAAFGAVGPPYHLAATYFQAALQVEAGDLAAAAERFEACLGLQGNDPRQVEIRELCAMGAGRVYAELGRSAESLDRYQLVPYTSPHFDEALYEVSWGFVRAGSYPQALRTAAMIVDLAPESQLAPEATILTGHLELRLGQWAAATEAFDQVITRYAPVRDEIEAVLSSHEDPVRYLDELIGRQGKAFDVASVLPPVAVAWASAERDVGNALDLVLSLDAARKDLDDSRHVLDRVDAMVQRSGGLDVVPQARNGWIAADSVENGSARARGPLADRASELGAPLLPPDQRAELQRVQAARRALEPRLQTLPRTLDEVEARRRRMRDRVDQAERAAFQLGLQADAAGAAVAATEAWVSRHRAEILSDPSGRDQLGAELRQQRASVTSYDEAIRGLRQEIAATRDAVGGTAQAAGDAGLRLEYQALLEQERRLLRPARAALPPGQAQELARGDALLERLDQADAEAERLKARFAGAARQGAVAVTRRLAAERDGLQREQEQLAAVQLEARDVVGRIAFRSFSAVRAQFYRLVLKADVGIVDVAWSRKRERVERIQQLSQQKASALEALDRDFKVLAREVEPP